MSKSKRIGTAFERAVADYLTAQGIPSRRVALAGKDDEGDVRSEDHLFIVECKGGHAAERASRNQLEQWLDDADRERKNADVPYGFLVTKVAGKGVAQSGQWSVHISAEMFNAVWQSTLHAHGFVTVNLETFARWWLARP